MITKERFFNNVDDVINDVIILGEKAIQLGFDNIKIEIFRDNNFYEFHFTERKDYYDICVINNGLNNVTKRDYYRFENEQLIYEYSDVD